MTSYCPTVKKGNKLSKVSLNSRARKVGTRPDKAKAASTKKPESELARVARKIGMPREVVATVEQEIEEYIDEFTAAIHDFYSNRRKKLRRRKAK